MAASDIILEVLEKNKGQYLAVHEITEIARKNGDYISDNAAASRLCIDLKGKVEGRFRAGKHFKEWKFKEETCATQN